MLAEYIMYLVSISVALSGMDTNTKAFLIVFITYLHFEKLWSSVKLDLNCHLDSR